METCRGPLATVVTLACSLALSSCSGPSTASKPSAGVPSPSPTAAPAARSSESAGAPAQGAVDESATRTQEPAFAPEQATGAVKGIPAPTNTAPIVAVANYFTDLPGVDTASLRPRQREKFLQRVNSELCTCGCKNDTLARCYVNDARCPVVKGMVQRVFEESKTAK